MVPFPSSPRTFTARYDGRCAADCGERIHPGDRVEYAEDQLVHEGCVPSDVEAERPPRPICPECFTEIALNGACSCL